MRVGFLLLVWALAWPASAQIRSWVRPAGDPLVLRHAQPKGTVWSLADRPLTAHSLKDLQYGEVRQYKAMPLFALLDAHRPKAPHVDAAILRFANGMAVTLPLDAETRAKTTLWIAREAYLGGRWQATFEPVRHGPEGTADPRPITFKGNKIVAETAYHPAVASGAAFSPWQWVDSLVAVEWVSLAAWDRQFAVDSPATAQGLPVYRAWCSHCHGVRKVGARFGWDFVEPMPAVDQRPSVNDLLFHVRFRASDATQQGLMMPALKGLTRTDGERLHAWLSAIVEQPLKAYKP